MDVFEVCSGSKLYSRMLALLRVSQDIFFSGFLWQGFSLATSCDSNTTAYFFITGFGSGVGAMFGHIISNLTFKDNKPQLSSAVLLNSIAYFFALFLGTGTAWQKIVNICVNHGYNFVQTFFFVWMVTFLLFFATITILRTGNSLVKETFKLENEFETSLRRLYFDLQLAISVGLADAFFVATIKDTFPDNTLSPVFGVDSDTNAFTAMVVAGSSCLTGFVISQVVQNTILVDSWLDPVTSTHDPLAERKAPLLL
jgi:hypothetical protein